jgi:acyl-CoA synthetase (AMP-forming)/AMP-acid ligase II
MEYNDMYLKKYQLENFMNHKDVNIIGSYHYGELGYILSMIGSWKSNLTFVPLSTSHPEQELKYFVEDSNMGLLLHSLGIYFLFSSCFFFFII